MSKREFGEFGIGALVVLELEEKLYKEIRKHAERGQTSPERLIKKVMEMYVKINKTKRRNHETN
ncbi:MAG: hypothetical protein DDT19_02296 [Syntrophomonadaceae bacterium]|nr:hypothetical protein [Bacillota bacterium]